ncbi:MAG: hypothetical protein ICV66_02615 [Chitinophagaceae bacterium]|nr:hypothetical protein [Chitinophagaceae bacterium]
MKQVLFIAALLFNAAAFSQSEKYIKTMQETIAVFDTTRGVDGMRELANKFERIGDAEKAQWLPYYYAALASVNMGYGLSGGQMGVNADKIDPLADKAEQLINKADELSKNNSEIYVVKKMIATLRLMVDPMNRYMKYGPEAAQYLETAKKLNPENPRVYYLEGQDKFYTPEQFGGSKTEAVKLFEQALKKFDVFKPESSIHPSWGKRMTEYFLQEAQNK